MNPIFDFIKKGLAEDIKTLLNENKEFATIPDDLGLSPFITSVYHSQIEIAKLILSFLDKLTVFEAAAFGSFSELARNIAEEPDLVNKFAPDGYTPLCLACFFGNYEIAEILIDNDADVNLASLNETKVRPIHAAVASNKSEIAELLISNGADINLPQHLNIYPIHSAVHRKNNEMITLLLQNSADLSVITDAGQTALSIADEEGSKEIEKLLKVFML